MSLRSDSDEAKEIWKAVEDAAKRTPEWVSEHVLAAAQEAREKIQKIMEHKEALKIKESVDLGKFTKQELLILKGSLKIRLAVDFPLEEYRKVAEKLYDRVTKTLDVYFPQ